MIERIVIENFKSLRHVDWVDNTIAWQMHCANKIVDTSEWNQIFYVGRRDDVDGQTKHAGH